MTTKRLYEITRFATFGVDEYETTVAKVWALDAPTALAEWGDNFSDGGDKASLEGYVLAFPWDIPPSEAEADCVGYHAALLSEVVLGGDNS